MKGEEEEAVGVLINLEDYTLKATCMSVGNPHCVIFVDALSPSIVKELGPRIECHPLFPLRVNVEFVEILNMSELVQRSWERGAGETLSSATGACAAVAAAIRTGKGKGKMFVRQPGGLLEVNVTPEGNFLLRGPVRRVFSGELDEDWWEKSRLIF
jgi:diaminopimelate epimerase